MTPTPLAGSAPPVRALGAATLGLTLAALLAARTRRRPTTPAAVPVRTRVQPPVRPRVQPDMPPCPDPEAARQLYLAAAMLAASVLSDSALEHYRGSFENPGMFAPLASAGLVLAASTRAARHPARPAPALPFRTACAVGAAGLGFHAYNVTRRPGGLSWGNLFYAAPLGAPAALSLAGLLGLCAHAVGRGSPTLAGQPRGKLLALLAAGGLAGTSLEAALLHFRGAFQNPAMWLPVSLPPVGAVLLAASAAGPAAVSASVSASVSAAASPTPLARLARAWLAACGWLGALGAAFHARGVARRMGGWRNWRQNLLAGPPLPAPPSFSALALAGRAALALRWHDAARTCGHPGGHPGGRP